MKISKNLLKYIFLVVSTLVITIVVTMFLIYKPYKSQKNDMVLSKKIHTIKITKPKSSMNSFGCFTKNDLKKDMEENYSFLSKREQKIILSTILAQSKKYNINPLILYSLIYTESSMRPWIEHSKILIKIKGKKKYIRAVGLGGVVWEWWKTQLIKNKIAFTRADLFNPEINIKAIAYIYNNFYTQKKLKKASTQDESAMIRYFGGGYKWYFVKIDKKIMSLIRKKIYR